MWSRRTRILANAPRLSAGSMARFSLPFRSRARSSGIFPLPQVQRFTFLPEAIMLMTIQVAKAAAAVVLGAVMLLEPSCKDASNILNFESLVTTGDVVSTQYKLVGSELFPGAGTDPLLVVARRDAPSLPNVMQVSGSSSPSVLVTMPTGAFEVHARVAVGVTSKVHIIAYGSGITEIGRAWRQVEAGAGFVDLDYKQLNGTISKIMILGEGSRLVYVDLLIIDWHTDF
jgi:hypothetical protein